MKYMVLLYSPDPGRPYTDAEWADMMPAYNAYYAILEASGSMVDGAALHDVRTATTVRVRDGKRVVSDGPFAETKEVLGGFYIIDCKTLDDALELAAQCPAVHGGSVEVRPVVEFPQ